MIPRVRLAGRWVGENYAPFVVAEMSGNHNGSLKNALKIIDAAKDAGAHAIKFQTYTPDTMTLNLRHGEFFIGDKESLWYGKTLYELYEKAYTPWSWHEKLFNHCKRLGIIFFSTPFDATSVDFLESLHVPFYKIASFENTDFPLIQKVCATGKPVIISTGMASLREIEEAVAWARQCGCKDLVLLKCTSVYPAEAHEANLLTLPEMRRRFKCVTGLSDHTLGVGVALGAAALGASLIEKHFTVSRRKEGVDSAFSMEPAELRLLVEGSKQAWQARGRVTYEPTPAEKKSLVFRRTLYAAEDIQKGALLTAQNVRAVRPGLGLSPKHYHSVLGRRASKNIRKGTPLNWKLMEAAARAAKK